VPGDSKAEIGSTRSAIRWGLFLAAVATFGFHLPRLAPEYRAWRGAVRLNDRLGAESWRSVLVADSIGLLIVLAFGLVIFFVLRPRNKSKP
jgi:hypothetical protein